MSEAETVGPLIEAALKESKKVAAEIKQRKGKGRWMPPDSTSDEAEIYQKTTLYLQNVLEFLQASRSRLSTNSRLRTQSHPRPEPRNPSPRS